MAQRWRRGASACGQPGAGSAPTPCVAVHVEVTQVARFAERLRRLDGLGGSTRVQVVAEHAPLVYARPVGGDAAEATDRDANGMLFEAADAELGSGDRIAAHRVYRLDWSCADAQWVPLSLALRALQPRAVLRVCAFPRALQLRLSELLSAAGFRLHPTRFTAELHAVAQPALSPFVHFGVVSRRCRRSDGGRWSESSTLPQTAAQAPSRAFFKLQESLRDHLGGLSAGAHALDIGASPGGWTDCLVASGAGLVVAVDPGELSIVIGGRPIVHIRARLEDAMEAVRAAQRRARPGRAFDLCVCDINARVEPMARLVARAAELLAPGARLVATLKLGRKPTDAAVQRALAAATATLSPQFGRFRLEWLHANTQNERTLFAERRRDA